MLLLLFLFFCKLPFVGIVVDAFPILFHLVIIKNI